MTAARRQRFGAETSGQTLLYDRDGRLLFSGGTTGSRGHDGDNAGFASHPDAPRSAADEPQATAAGVRLSAVRPQDQIRTAAKTS